MNKSVLSNLDHLSSLSIDEIEQAISTLPIMVQNHIMDETDADKLRYKLMTAKDKKILETYPIRMWQTKDGTWKAHVPDATKDRNRRILQGKPERTLKTKYSMTIKKNQIQGWCSLHTLHTGWWNTRVCL